MRDDPAGAQAALRTQQALCRLEGVLPLWTVSDAVVWTRKRLAAMAQPGRLRAKRDALEAKQETFQKALSVAAEMVHDAIERLSHQQHELAVQYSEILGLLPGTVSVPAGRLATRGPSSTDKTYAPLFKSPHRRAGLRLASMCPSLCTVRQ